MHVNEVILLRVTDCSLTNFFDSKYILEAVQMLIPGEQSRCHGSITDDQVNDPVFSAVSGLDERAKINWAALNDVWLLDLFQVQFDDVLLERLGFHHQVRQFWDVQTVNCPIYTCGCF